jgi:histidinol-phosphate aminotransferase
MPLSRRAFVAHFPAPAFRAATAPLLAARGREAATADPPTPTLANVPDVRIDSNENPNGPCPSAVRALLDEMAYAGRYPFNSRPSEKDLLATLAGLFSAAPEQIVLGAGSGELLRNAVRAFTGPDRAFVTASPSYEQPERLAELIGTPVRRVPVDGRLRLDLAGMADAAVGAGLVFVCNPNNPTATVHPARAIADLVENVKRRSPQTTVLVDEAYHDYVTTPDYATAAPLALAQPGVLVTRTLSKAHGMAGLRVGYALGHGDTIKALGRYRLSFNVNVLGLAAAIASLRDPEAVRLECARNAEARAYTLGVLAQLGCHASESQANFVFAEIKRPAREFREACRTRGILVGRDFPPYEKTHARVSIGTLDEMRRAAGAFRAVLADARPS